MRKENRLASISLCVMALLLALSVGITTPSYAETTAQSVDTLQGVISIVYGDPPQDASSTDPIINIRLLDSETGAETANLQMGIGLAHTVMGQTVQVRVARLSSPAQAGESLPRYLVQEVIPLATPNEPTPAPQNPVGGISTPQLVGSQAFINLLCKFPNVGTVPKNPADYAGLFANSYGGVDHFWRTMSYNALNLAGTGTSPQWVNMPQPSSYYILTQTSLRFSDLLQHCVTASDSIVNFSPYIGVNLMFNDDLGCCAWGGGPYFISTNEGNKFVRVTWNPPWSQNYETMAHETGHALGLPHSSGPSHNPPSELSIYVSQWDVMSNGGTCNPSSGTWGCVPAGTIAYYMTYNNWIPASRQLKIPNHMEATITMRRTQEDVGVGYILGLVPINNSSTVFYSVEVRDLSGYDNNTPAAAVVIHHIDLSRIGNTGPALVVNGGATNDVNGTAAQWQAGETFTDAVNNITIRVISKTGNDYIVEIRNDADALLFTENELLAQLRANATGDINYFLVDYQADIALIVMTIGSQTAKVTVQSVNTGGELVRFAIVSMTTETDAPLPAATMDIINIHLLPTLNLALDALVATREINANVGEIILIDTGMGVVTE